MSGGERGEDTECRRFGEKSAVSEYLCNRLKESMFRSVSHERWRRFRHAIIQLLSPTDFGKQFSMSAKFRFYSNVRNNTKGSAAATFSFLPKLSQNILLPTRQRHLRKKKPKCLNMFHVALSNRPSTTAPWIEIKEIDFDRCTRGKRKKLTTTTLNASR